MSASQVTAGGVVVKVLADNQELEKGLRASAQKLAGWAAAARATVGAGLAATGSVVTAGLAGAAAAGTAVASSVGKAGRAIKTAFSGADVAAMANAIQRLTPVTTRVWDVTQSGIGRGTRLLSTMRQGLVAAGVAALPLLHAFDGLAQKSAGIVTGAKWGSLIRGDFKAAGMFSQLQKPAREAWLQDRWRQGGATGVVGASVKRLFNPAELFEGMARFSINPLKTIGASLSTFRNIGFGGIGGRLNIAAKSLAGAGIGAAAGLVGRLGANSATAAMSIASMATSAVKGATSVTGIARAADQAVRSVSRLLPKLSSLGSGLRSVALRGGLVGAGILGTLTAAAGVKSGLGDLFSAGGFAKHAGEMGDSADKHKTTVGVYSNYHAAAQIAGVSLDDALSDPKKMAKVEAQRGRAASLGGFVTASQLALAREANAATAEMGIAFRAVGTALGTAVLPQIIDGVRWTTNFASAVAGFIQENPKLIQQLFTVGKAFAIGATAAAGIATAIALVGNPIGMAAVAVGSLAAAFPMLWEMASPYLGGIGQIAADLKTGFDQVFGGIVNALSAGNIGLAAQVAMAGLAVVWEAGIAWARTKWAEWSASLASVIDSGLTEARIVLDKWFPGFELAFSESIGVIGDTWTKTVTAFLNTWDTTFGEVKKVYNTFGEFFKAGMDAVRDSWKSVTGVIDAWMPQFKTAVSDSASFMQKMWTSAIKGLVSAWESATKSLRKALSYLGIELKSVLEILDSDENRKIDLEVSKKVTDRNATQAQVLAGRKEARSDRRAAIESRGAEAVNREELEGRKASRKAAVAQVRENLTGVGSRFALAVANLKAAMQQAKQQAEAKKEERAAKVEVGTLKAKDGSKEAETRGAAANDIRTREGLQDVLIAYRGQGGASLNTLASQGTEQIKTIKEGNTIHEKNRVLLDVIAQKKGDDKPIG